MAENVCSWIRWEYLIDNPSLTIAFVALIVNIFAFFRAAWWIRRQAHAVDVNNHFQIQEKISHAWRKYRDESKEKKDFEFVELLNLLETLSRLYNSCIIHDSTREMVRENLSEVIPHILDNEYAVFHLKNTRSGPETYSEIERFARSNNIDWPL